MIYGRRPRQLLVVWGVALSLIGLLQWFEMQAPAFHEILLPVYWVVFAVAVLLTWRWLRSRSAKDRRRGDRRRTARREEESAATET